MDQATQAGKSARRMQNPAARTSAETAVLATLLYYDRFDFPLSLDELQRFAIGSHTVSRGVETGSCAESIAAIAQAVEGLLRQGLVEIEPDASGDALAQPSGASIRVCLPHRGDSFAKRRRAETRFREEKGDIWQQARLIQSFPLVEGVALSGTLSKRVFHDGDDYDFFVITRPRRVWLCRTILMLYKRIALAGSRERFCINYLVGTDSLEVPDHDLFTAVEVAWLLPTTVRRRAFSAGSGRATDPFDRFFAANAWVTDLLANWHPGRQAQPEARTTVTMLLDAILRLPPFGLVDHMLCRLIARRNARRYREHLGSDFAQAMRHDEGQSKHHPRALRGRILQDFRQRCLSFDRQHGTEVATLVERAGPSPAESSA